MYVHVVYTDLTYQHIKEQFILHHRNKIVITF